MTLLHAVGLRRRFGGVVALDGVDVSIGAGEVVAVIGPNGSGKSTLVNVLTGLDRPDSGRVTLGGTDVTRWTPARLARKGVTRTFQDGRLLDSLSVLENVLLGLHAVGGTAGAALGGFPVLAGRRRHRAIAALGSVGLAEVWWQRTARLSHGQRRRVELARTLVGNPRLVVLDEPTAGLTPEDTDAVAALVTGVCSRGGAVLLVEHDLDVVGAVADRVIVLDEGAVVATGPPAVVLGDPGVARLLGITGPVTERLAG